MTAGKLIVIDGTDGSGKATQTKLLVSALKQQGKRVKILDFPRYGEPSAWFVEQYLNGKFGTLDQVSAHQASYFYALDRYAASFDIRSELATGTILISNRYTSANTGHQGAKFTDPEERKKFFSWLDKLEHTILDIPRPDQTIILHVPAVIAQQLVDKKDRREYIGGKKRDLHEANINHLKQAEVVYQEMTRVLPNMTLIECYEQETLLPPTVIHTKIMQIVTQFFDTWPTN